jgi:hypothetical protein
MPLFLVTYILMKKWKNKKNKKKTKKKNKKESNSMTDTTATSMSYDALLHRARIVSAIQAATSAYTRREDCKKAATTKKKTALAAFVKAGFGVSCGDPGARVEWTMTKDHHARVKGADIFKMNIREQSVHKAIEYEKEAISKLTKERHVEATTTQLPSAFERLTIAIGTKKTAIDCLEAWLAFFHANAELYAASADLSQCITAVNDFLAASAIKWKGIYTSMYNSGATEMGTICYTLVNRILTSDAPCFPESIDIHRVVADGDDEGERPRIIIGHFDLDPDWCVAIKAAAADATRAEIAKVAAEDAAEDS